VIQKNVQDPLAESILSGDIKDGEVVHITADREGLMLGSRLVAPTPPKPSVPNGSGTVVSFPKGS
jgi:ATP-dependent Clp protease ATP-binding subunit ClpB